MPHSRNFVDNSTPPGPPRRSPGCTPRRWGRARRGRAAAPGYCGRSSTQLAGDCTDLDSGHRVSCKGVTNFCGDFHLQVWRLCRTDSPTAQSHRQGRSPCVPAAGLSPTGLTQINIIFLVNVGNIFSGNSRYFYLHVVQTTHGSNPPLVWITSTKAASSCMFRKNQIFYQ